MFAEVPWGRASNDSGVVENGNFQLVRWLFLDTLEMRLALLYSDMQSIVGFSVIPKCMTLNDLEWLFRVKFCFRAGLLALTVRTSKNNYVKTNKDRHIVSAA